MSTTETKKMILDEKWVKVTVLVFVAIGAINWGCVAMKCNLVDMCCKNRKVQSVLYGLIGLAGLIALYYAYKAYDGQEEYYSPQYYDYTSSVGFGDGEYVGVEDYNSFSI